MASHALKKRGARAAPNAFMSLWRREPSESRVFGFAKVSQSREIGRRFAGAGRVPRELSGVDDKHGATRSDRD
jgi:hypothetical protein